MEGSTYPATATKISARLADVKNLMIREKTVVIGIMARSLFHVPGME